MRSSPGFCISINADYQPDHEGLNIMRIRPLGLPGVRSVIKRGWKAPAGYNRRAAVPAETIRDQTEDVM
jgi:hypothetical protein